MRDGWLSWPCCLTESRRLNHKVVTCPASSLAQDRDSLPADTSILTFMLCRQHKCYCQQEYYHMIGSNHYSWCAADPHCNVSQIFKAFQYNALQQHSYSRTFLTHSNNSSCPSSCHTCASVTKQYNLVPATGW